MAVKKGAKKTTSTKKEGTESFKVTGDQLLAKVKKLIKEGNIREIRILNKNGKTLIVLPLTIGVVGVVLAPMLAAVGALAALVTECTVEVKKK